MSGLAGREAGGETGTTGAMAEAGAIYAFPRNLVLAASAGTGKTHALVGVAVHLLIGACRATSGGLRPPIPPDALVATTFSRKAAGEIRSRLRDELEKLASGDARAAYRADLLSSFARAGEDHVHDAEIASRAARAICGLGRSQIGTLHSFAASIVREHALLLGLAPDFDLADEEASTERAAQSISDVLERHAADSEVASLIQLAGGVEGFIDLLRRLLARIAEDGHAAADVQIADGDAAEVDEILRVVMEHAPDLEEDPRLGEPARRLRVAYEGVDPLSLEDAMGELWAVPKVGKVSAVAAAFFELRESISHASSVKLRDRGRGLVRRWCVRDRMLPRARALRELLVACEREIAARNRADSALGFTDILRAARDLLRDHPDVAAETGARYGALLVDEFQDTSPVQRDLVQLLWEQDRRGDELRAPGTIPAASDLRADGLLIVGDRKQSIYGFRGADVAVFAELCVTLAGAPAREALAIPSGVVWEPKLPTADFIALRHNRRGELELLDFANAMSRLSLVPQRLPPELYEVTYAPLTEDLLSPGPRSDAAPRPRTHWLRVVVPPGKMTSSLLTEAQVMAARIGAIVRSGEVTVRGAPACWRDIAILAPRREMLSAAAYTLAEAGIPHVIAGVGFFGAAEVRDVIAMLACLVDPDDSLARAEVLRGPWAGATDRTLVALTDRHTGLADAAHWNVGERRLLVDADGRPAVLALARVITALGPTASRLGPGAALREAVRALSLEETLILLPRGEQRVANVRKLLAMADRATNPTELLHRLRRASDTEQREGEAETFSDDDDAVRLLTVHGSKGLSFPIVFLPEAGAISRGRSVDPIILETGHSRNPMRVLLRALDEIGSSHDTPSYARAKRDLLRREAAERLRLRYVAITRASERMYFVGDRAPPKGPRETYETSTAAVLARLAVDDPTRRAAQLTVETGESLLHRITRDAARRPERLAAYRSLPKARIREVVVGVDSVLAAAHCTRRFQLDHLLAARAFTEGPLPRTASEFLGALASAGDWGAAVVRDCPRLLQRETVVFVDDCAPDEGDEGSSRAGESPAMLSVLASVDVAVAWAGGATDLVSFRAPTLDPDAHALHASLLFHAVSSRSTTSTTTRVGVLFSDEPGCDPTWVAPRDLAWTRAAVRDAVRRMLATPRRDLAPKVPHAVCVQTGCGHAAACYPEGEARLSRRASRQTSFGFFEAEVGLETGRRRRVRGRTGGRPR